MLNISSYEYECTKKCKCKEHGQEITLALTKRCVSDDKLAAFIGKTCQNFPNIVDTFGRTALHMASSVGRYAIAEWLLNHGASLCAKDRESGSSALHRAIYYGCIDCAVLLIRYGGSLDQLDNDNRKPLQHICKFWELRDKDKTPVNNEILVWGSNKNYNLSFCKDEDDQAIQQNIEFFRKDNICVKSVALSTYHSLFLDSKGIVYSVGHGNGGRLGIGTEKSLTCPKRIKFPFKSTGEKIISISCSKYHSLVLSNKCCVYACGLNENQQLGIEGVPEKLMSFKKISSFSQYGTENLVKVIANDRYSVAYSKTELFVWGANCGQCGISQNQPQILLPRSVQIFNKIIASVEASDLALAVCTSDKEVLLYYDYKVKALKAPTLEPIKAVCLVTDVSDKTKTSKSRTENNENTLKMLILTSTNSIFIWYEEYQKFLRCSLSHIRILDIEKIFYKRNQLMILSNGDVYMGTCMKIPVHNIIENHSSAWISFLYSKRDIATDQRIRIELKLVPNIDRAIDIFCNEDFESFAVLQENPRKYYVLPHLTEDEYSFKKLLNESQEFDSIHDVVFHVDNEIFYAHKFIIFSKSAGLMNLIKQYQDKDIYLNFNGLTCKMFELILKYIYTNYFILKEDIDDIYRSMSPDFQGDNWTVLHLFLKFVEKFELNDLAQYIKQLIERKTVEKPKFNRLQRSSLPELYDVTIKCADNKEIKAHKCMLVTRLEYFNMMFNNSWSENKIVNLTTIPIGYLEPIIDFLYNSDIEHFRSQNYSENFLYNMIVICDQFFIERLRKICEILILDRIAIKKCGEMLDFACAYNCSVLKKGCLNFICQNLSRVLSQHSLECCEPDVLKEINATYRKIFQNVFDFRMITPDSNAVSDEILQSFVLDFSVDLQYKMLDNLTKGNKSKTPKSATKFAYSKRQYEKYGIMSLKESNENFPVQKVEKKTKSSVEEEAEKINEDIHTEVNTWEKVYDKKEMKKKPIGNINPLLAVKVNTIIKSEEKRKNDYINLNQIAKNANNINIASKSQENDLQSPKPNLINLRDFTPVKTEKLSQKQRKRLSSLSKNTDVMLIPTKPVEIPKTYSPNAWGLNNSNPGHYSSPTEQSSFAEIMKSSPGNSISPTKAGFWSESPEKPLRNSIDHDHFGSASNSPSSTAMPSTSKKVDQSFSKILDDERRQKEYFERIKSKSLVLTQIEETAIAQLKEFYNVDNVFDEIITIERRTIKPTMNFAVWQRN